MNERIATLTIKRLRISDLKPHPRNPRTHPKPGSPAWQVLERSLDKDYFDPLVTNERNGLMVSGHLRLKVMTAMGFTEADVVCVDYDEPLHLARMMAANTLLGEFEETIMASLARDLDIAGIDAALAGLTDKAMMALVECPVTGDDTEQAEDLVSKAELLQQKWKVAPGDLYQIGPHRLLCGVCESPDNWQRLLGESQADMIWCDPPYNVAYDRSQKKRVAMKKKEGETPHVTPEVILNDDMPREEYLECLNDWFSMGAARLKPGGAVYIAHAESFGLETRLAARDAGFYIAQCLIWVKQAWTMGRQDYQWQHEPVLYGWKAGAAHHWQGGYSQATVIDFDVDLHKMKKPELITLVNHLRNAMDTSVVREPRSVCSDLHPTVKPTRLVARHIWNSSERDAMIMELFNGSGTTMAAAHQTGRRCAATEADPKYVAVGLERMSLLGLPVEKQNGPC